ncbi:transmembrane protein 87B-like isoform X2 [Physella acuta]|uniref:transmembrane protein 87B-like isoform X2 n=1 Tax=Physella acuta TaxID=109671 RepID=UPI0027DAD9EA|nr:transmembrane protein 87B-like isoform X2 [Physella acuta]
MCSLLPEKKMASLSTSLYFVLVLLKSISAIPEQGIWDSYINKYTAKFYLQMPWQKLLPTQKTEYATGSFTHYCDTDTKFILHAKYLLKTWADGYYLFVLNLDHADDLPEDFLLKVNVMISNGYSYISAVDYPLLIFYRVMALVYLGFGIVWLILLACNWPDLHRIHFWIGGIILIGMLEKAVFFGEYENINNTGQSVRGAIIFAELVSCLKRSLARMLVIIVSLGYGIVKPRLGQTFYKVFLVGVVFFILASIEGCMRILNEKATQSTQGYLLGFSLLTIDIIIFYWIIKSLRQSLRTLRNKKATEVQLLMYRHFRNILIFFTIVSQAYMIWFLVHHQFQQCFSDLKQQWIYDALWQILFSMILIVIMMLWRPTSHNLRHAFSHLLNYTKNYGMIQGAPMRSYLAYTQSMDNRTPTRAHGYHRTKLGVNTSMV